jgi:hypothetical protein
MRRALLIFLGAFVALALVAGPALAAKDPIVPDAIYADGELFGTVLQGSLPYNGHDASYDLLFGVPGQQAVSEAGPGNADYNGGRWLPVSVTWNSDPYLLTSYDEVQAAAAAGDITLGEPDRDGAFLCPLIPQH